MRIIRALYWLILWKYELHKLGFHDDWGNHADMSRSLFSQGWWQRCTVPDPMLWLIVRLCRHHTEGEARVTYAVRVAVQALHADHPSRLSILRFVEDRTTAYLVDKPGPSFNELRVALDTSLPAVTRADSIAKWIDQLTRGRTEEQRVCIALREVFPRIPTPHEKTQPWMLPP
jgi:hypothetical protein